MRKPTGALAHTAPGTRPVTMDMSLKPGRCAACAATVHPATNTQIVKPRRSR